MARVTETKRILMERDELTSEEADELIAETREALNNGDWEAMEDYLGLEPDYIFDVLFQKGDRK